MRHEVEVLQKGQYHFTIYFLKGPTRIHNSASLMLFMYVEAAYVFKLVYQLVARKM